METLDLLSDIPEPTPESLREARKAAGQNQARAAATAGLGDVMRWSDYERGKTKIEPARWALYLLATDQHPAMRIAIRRAPRVPQIPVHPAPADSQV